MAKSDEWFVEEGRPSWHQARAGHGAAGRRGFSSKIQALRYMARFKRHHPHEPLRLVAPRRNPKFRETPKQTQRRLLRAIERADREGYTGYVGSRGGLFDYPRFRAIHRRYMHEPKRRNRGAKPMRRRARRRNRTAAQRAAFRRMIAGLRRYKARGRRNPRGVYKRPKRRRHLYAARSIPEGAPTKGLVVLNRRRRKTRKRRRNPMARRHRSRRRRRHVAMANPRRRRHRRRHSRSRRRPRFTRVRGRLYRRRNPGGIRQALKTVFAAGIPAVGAGAVAGFVHNKWFATSSKLVQIGVKVAQAALWGMLFRRKPVVAYAAMGAALGSIGEDFGRQFSGNMAGSISALIQENPHAMGVLVNAMQGMGLQLDTGVSLGDAGTALDQGLPANSYTDVNLG